MEGPGERKGGCLRGREVGVEEWSVGCLMSCMKYVEGVDCDCHFQG